MPDRPTLSRLIKEARAKWQAMSPEERQAMHAVQVESWVGGTKRMRGSEARRTGRASWSETATDTGRNDPLPVAIGAAAPCPFCGTRPYLDQVASALPGGGGVRIACGRTTCPAQPSVTAPTEAEALLHWNTRKG